MTAGRGPERALLVACAHVSLSSQHLAELKRTLEEPIDWQAVLELSSWHRVSALLAKHLGHPEVESHVPEMPQCILQKVYRANSLLFLRQRAELAAVVEALSGAGIRVIVLKGAALAEEVYGSPALRPMGDLDLLVEPENFEHAHRIARELGYSSGLSGDIEGAIMVDAAARHGPRLHSADGECHLEIHRHLLHASVPFRFDVWRFWERARPTVVGGISALTLPPDALLLHLCLGFFLDSRTRYPSRKALARLVDIAETVRHFEGEIDWESLVDALQREAVLAPAAWGLLTAHRLLGVPSLPEAVLKLCGGVLDEAQIEAFIERRVFRESPWVFHELVNPPHHARWNFVKSAAKRVFPARAHLETVYRIPSPGSVPLSTLYRWHLRDLRRCCIPYLMRPTDWPRDLRIDRWLHHTYAGT